MRTTSYAAIVIGSKNILMKIYEIGKNGVRVLNQVSHNYDLGQEAYITRKITFSQIDEICQVLNDFKVIMKEFGVTEHRCYATSVLRNASNQISVVNHIKIRTGIDILVRSNSELRFQMCMGIQISELSFEQIIQKNTAVLDIGSGSAQVSFFDKGVLYSTQNMNIGSARVRSTLEEVKENVLDYVSVMEEYIQYELNLLKNTYMKDKLLKNIIIIGDEIKQLRRIEPKLASQNTLNSKELDHIYKIIKEAAFKDIISESGISREEAQMMLPSILIYKIFLENAKAETIFICDTNLCDGSVAAYCSEIGKKVSTHDFYNDIIASAKYIGKRYRYNKVHAEYIRGLALMIFDKTTRYHGLSDRDRLLLEIAAILHDIGKFVNINKPGQIGYELIMSTEMLGISHKERKDVASVILYNTEEIPDLMATDPFAYSEEEYLKIAKLSAILRIANALDRGHQQKYENISIAKKGKELMIIVESNQDITLEITLFSKKARYFSEIMGITPILKQKRVL